MKTLLSFFTSILATAGLFAQHIINNDFEAGGVPITLGQIAECDGYFAAMGTPDYFKADGIADVNVPLNFYGYQEDCTGCGGTAYVGFQGGEIIGSELDVPLQAFGSYRLEFKINLSNRSRETYSGVGFVFGTHENAMGGTPPQRGLYTDSTTYHVPAQLGNWNSVSIDFISDSNYTHIFFGNLKTIGVTNEVVNMNVFGPSYFYVGLIDLIFTSLDVEGGNIDYVRNGELKGRTDILGRDVTMGYKGLLIERYEYDNKTYFRKVMIQ